LFSSWKKGFPLPPSLSLKWFRCSPVFLLSLWYWRPPVYRIFSIIIRVLFSRQRNTKKNRLANEFLGEMGEEAESRCQFRGRDSDEDGDLRWWCTATRTNWWGLINVWLIARIKATEFYFLSYKFVFHRRFRLPLLSRGTINSQIFIAYF